MCEVCEDLPFSVTTTMQQLWMFIWTELFEGLVFSLGLFGHDKMIRSTDNNAINIDE